MRRQSPPTSISNAEKEKERRRIAWKIQQELERKHEKLKRKKIEEYEKERAKQLGLDWKSKSPSRNCSESESSSSYRESYCKSPSTSRTNNSQAVSIEVDTLEKNRMFSKKPNEILKVDENELRQIKVKIYQNIPTPSIQTNEIRRGIYNPEDIILKRREDEGSKPLFDREELKNFQATEANVEELRTVEVVSSNDIDKSPYSKRSESSSPERERSKIRNSRSRTRPSYSQHSSSKERSRQRCEDHSSEDHKTDRYSSYTKETRREEPQKRSVTRSHSRDREYCKEKHNYSRSNRNERGHSSNRGRSRDRSYERQDRRQFSKERRNSAGPYVEPIPVPIYYGGFPPRPIFLGPVLPSMGAPIIRSHLPGPPMRAPFPPRFPLPQNMYRGDARSNPRFRHPY